MPSKKNWKYWLKRRERMVDEIEAALKVKVAGMQNALYGQLSGIINDFSTDSEGRIKFTAGNIRNARKVNTVFAVFGASKKRSLAIWIKNRVHDLLGLNKAYIKSIDKSFDARTVEERALIQLMGSIGYDVKKDVIVKGSWLDAVSRADEVKMQVFRRINSAMSSKMDLKTFRANFRDDFTGKNRLGLLAKHYDFHTQNLFMAYDRTIADNYAAEAGMKYFVYTGGTIKTTRPFCEKNADKVFHQNQFPKWDLMSWDGKIPNAPTKQVAGGYRCRHHFAYVSKQMAARMIRGGRKHGLTESEYAALFA